MKIKATQVVLDAVNKSNKLRPIKEQDAKKLKSVLAHAYFDIQQRCEANSITTFLVYGSALGAYRHHGFIPWDDDLDIAVSREDWEHLKEIFPSVFGDKYELEGPNYQSEDSAATWGKIFLKNTKYVEIFNINTPYHKGIFIDVFIIDGVSDNRFIRKFESVIAQTMRFVANSMAYYRYPSKTMDEVMSVSPETKNYLRFRKFIGFLFFWVSHKKWVSLYDYFISRHRQSKDTTMFFGESVVKRDYWLPVQKIIFEGLEVNIPNHISTYLEISYGSNYMELPPVEKREQHFIVELDFGSY